MCSNQDMSWKPNERIRLYSWARRVASLVVRWEMSFHSQSFILLSFLQGLLQIGATVPIHSVNLQNCPHGWMFPDCSNTILLRDSIN